MEKLKTFTISTLKIGINNQNEQHIPLPNFPWVPSPETVHKGQVSCNNLHAFIQQLVQIGQTYANATLYQPLTNLIFSTKKFIDLDYTRSNLMKHTKPHFQSGISLGKKLYHQMSKNKLKTACQRTQRRMQIKN